MTIKQGDIIRFKPEWQDAGDESVEFVAMEDEDGGRVLVGALNVLHHFTPTQVIQVSMIQA